VPAVKDMVLVVSVLNIGVQALFILDGQVHHMLLVIVVSQVVELVLVVHHTAIVVHQLNIVVKLLLLHLL